MPVFRSRQNKKSKDDTCEGFYIGWMPKAPLDYVIHIKKFIVGLIILIATSGIVLSFSQKKFRRAVFEFGKLTEVQGVYYTAPIPHLRVISEKDIFGNVSFITVPLVGYGKHGAAGVMQELSMAKGQPFDNRLLRIKGTLLYNDGKTIMQIDKNDNPIIAISDQKNVAAFLPAQVDLGEQIIKGEIVDPKCFFGVMKPGQGKPHKDCAIRCILGGIPPVLRVQNEKGEENYCLIVGPNGKAVNEAVKDYVAEPVSLSAKVVRYDDWIVLYVNDNIKRISYAGMLNKKEISCIR